MQHIHLHLRIDYVEDGTINLLHNTSSTITISTLITAYSGHYVVKKFKLEKDNAQIRRHTIIT